MTSPADLTLLDGVAWQGTAIPAGRARDLLAALVLAAPRSVPVVDLVDQVWADEEPAHPDKALQVQVSRIRAQTHREAVSRVGAGYRLGLREDQVDLLRLRQLVDDAHAARRAGDLDAARMQAREALGQTVSTAGEEGPLAETVALARALQSRASRLLGSVLLARGDADEALPLLEAALAESPDDEGRLADVLRAEAQVRGVPAALAHFASYAGRVRDALGTDPGEELQRLHTELLARDAPVRRGLKYDASPLLGRDDDVTRIRGLVHASRVVSIVGAGGLGKTRLAHLVGRLAKQPVVYLVELAGVTTPDGVLPEVAGVLGVRESVAERRDARLRADLRSRVAEKLGGAPALLVLDNCEHLVGAVADLVAFLVASTDTAGVLTTSRAPLGIAAEQVYLLPELDDDSAVALFEERARSARPGVRLDPAEVAGLVRRLDGLPLAIELAAAKARAMSVAEIARRLEDRFGLLSGHDRSAPDRHRTLEAVIAWSWNLLGEPEQHALRTLAVFPDGFSLEGASALLGHDALPELVELADQSLLVVREDVDPFTDSGELRYRFLETVREYGLRRLGESADRDETRARLRRWAVGTARAVAGGLSGVDQVETMQRCRAEAGNLVGVLRDAVDDGDIASAVPVVGALLAFWSIQGDHLAAAQLARELGEVVAAAPVPGPDQERELRGVLSMLVATGSMMGGEPSPALIARLRGVGVAGDGSRTDAFSRVLLAVLEHGDPMRDTVDGAMTATTERLCADPDRATAHVALQWATVVYEHAGDVARARVAADRAIELCSENEGPWTKALLQAQAAGLAAQLGDWDSVVTLAQEAIPVLRALGAAEDVSQLRSMVGYGQIAAGRLAEAEQLFAKIAEVERQGPVGWRVSALSGEAEIALARGDVDTGLRRFLDSLQLVEQRTLPGIATPTMLLPWVLYTEAVALFAHVRHGRRDDAGWLAARVAEKLPTLLAAEGMRLDLPVLGGVMLAVSSWVLTGGPDPETAQVALRGIALGERFGYHRALPTMAWANVRALVDPLAPGRLDDLTERYAGVPAVELLGEAAEVAGYIARR